MKFSSRSVIIWVAILSGGFYTFQLIKDYFESEMQGYSYYFSESALFSIVWLVFIPITYGIWKREWFNLSKNWILIVIPLLTLGHIFFYALLIWFISGIFMNQPFIIFRNFKFGLLEYFLIISIIYFLIILLFKLFSSKDIISEVPASYTQNLVLTKNGSNDIIPVSGIISIHANTPYVQVVTNDKKYLDQTSLKELQQQLDPNIFIRVHKSAIINLQRVKSYTSRMNGDYDITMDNGIQVRMSRNYTQDFKKLVKQDASTS
ncbi:MAG: LytTR family transcriptional regulator [Saprospiraceae bacterium]|mgnify:CR=1 FL=1|jgi:two-component system LytT family response regulator|nr:LytTR family transcriptional regulator [Saprospiraceae bacterium]